MPSRCTWHKLYDNAVYCSRQAANYRQADCQPPYLPHTATPAVRPSMLWLVDTDRRSWAHVHLISGLSRVCRMDTFSADSLLLHAASSVSAMNDYTPGHQTARRDVQSTSVSCRAGIRPVKVPTWYRAISHHIPTYYITLCTVVYITWCGPNAHERRGTGESIRAADCEYIRLRRCLILHGTNAVIWQRHFRATSPSPKRTPRNG